MKRKRIPVLASLTALLICLSACGSALVGTENPGVPDRPEETAETAEAADTQSAPEEEDVQSVPDETAKEEAMIYAHIGDRTLTIRPADNSSAEAFAALLEEGDLTVDMRDYGGFEKVGPLGTSLVTNDERITTEPGDVILYQGNQITIYYDVNTWTFTRLGRVEGLTPEELREALGDGDPTAVFSLKP